MVKAPECRILEEEEEEDYGEDLQLEDRLDNFYGHWQPLRFGTHIPPVSLYGSYPINPYGPGTSEQAYQTLPPPALVPLDSKQYTCILDNMRTLRFPHPPTGMHIEKYLYEQMTNHSYSRLGLLVDDLLVQKHDRWNPDYPFGYAPTNVLDWVAKFGPVMHWKTVEILNNNIRNRYGYANPIH